MGHFAKTSPIVTLWQQWAQNIPFTSRFTLRNAYFRGRKPCPEADQKTRESSATDQTGTPV
ncbi:hypothetical protein ABID19_002719 [Mesorhizobium robiniae]|uniref:Uncharacterized protein n=1 Tax=Mesorhizobium robiniae TaxID=559315 RepID=A0ABV2GN15_9HYPH